MHPIKSLVKIIIHPDYEVWITPLQSNDVFEILAAALYL